MKDPLKKRSTE